MYRCQSRLLPRKFLVEITRIGRAANSREVRRGDTFMIDIVKVYIFEEEVAFDIFCVGLASAETAGWVACQELRR